MRRIISTPKERRPLDRLVRYRATRLRWPSGARDARWRIEARPCYLGRSCTSGWLTSAEAGAVCCASGFSAALPRSLAGALGRNQLLDWDKAVQFTITHEGVPVGIVELKEPGEYMVVPVEPLPAYEALRKSVRAASIALADVALAAGSSPRTSEALRRGVDLGRVLELHDHAGALVPTDFIELTEWPGGQPPIAAMLRFRASHARVAAKVVPPPRRERGTDEPAA